MSATNWDNLCNPALNDNLSYIAAPCGHVWRAVVGKQGWNYDRECGHGYWTGDLYIGKEPPKPLVDCATGSNDGPGFTVEPPEPTSWEQAVQE